MDQPFRQTDEAVRTPDGPPWPDLPEDASRRLATRFLTIAMPRALRLVEVAEPEWREAAPIGIPDADAGADGGAAGQAGISLRHVPGTPDAEYRVRAFGDTLHMRLQLNVWRLVIVYTVPARELVDVTGISPRFARWQTGAGHAGWTVGWRDAVDPWDHERRMVETYCYAMLPRGFLVDAMAQLYWRTDIVQMTRFFMLEAKRGGIPLSDR